MKRKLQFIIFMMILVAVMLIPAFASAESEEPVIELEIGETSKGVLKDGKVKIYELEPTSNGFLTLTIKCYAKDELHTTFYPEGKSDPYPKVTPFNAGKGYTLLEYKAYVGPGKYRLELSNPTIVISGSYQIHTEFTPVYTIDGIRNDSLEHAVSISNNRYYPGVMTYEETEDYYSIKLTKSTQFKLKVSCNEKTWLNIMIKNSKGKVVNEGKAYHNTNVYLLDQKLAAGTYTIIISPNKNDGFYGRSYRLETGKYVPITAVSIPATKTMKPGDIYTFQPTLKPSKAAASCYYTSSNPDVVKVTLDGRVTAIRKGKATITVRPFEGKGMDTCIITVSKISVQKLTLNKTKISLTIGENYSLKATVTPKGAKESEPSWKSSDDKVATVNSAGKITAKGTGTCKITAKLEGKSASATVTVTKKPEATVKPKPTAAPTPTPAPTPEIVTVEGISMSSSLQLKVGETKELEITFTPENVTNKTLIWTCTDGDVISLQDGKVTGKKVGISTVVVTSINGKRSFCKIEVSN